MKNSKKIYTVCKFILTCTSPVLIDIFLEIQILFPSNMPCIRPFNKNFKTELLDTT